MKWDKNIRKILKAGILWSTTGFIFTVILQIFGRFFLANTPSWTEEASRWFFIYAIAFSAGLALKSRDYVYLDMFYNAFPPQVKRILRFMIPTMIFLLFFIVMIYAIQLIIIGLPEKSPSMGLSMSFAFVSIFLMAASICYYAFLQMMIARKNQKQ